jgi:Polysaccharide pyruvyl transferase
VTGRGIRVLVTGWPSFLHGEATAGDVLAMEAVRQTLSAAGMACDLAWSPVFRPGDRTLDQALPEAYTHLVFTCGPAHGEQVARLHERYRCCYRIAVGVSVPDPGSPAVTGFHAVLPRDFPGRPARADLSAVVPVPPVPVAAVILAGGQPEYADRGRHAQLTAELTGWLATRDCARIPLDTRLAPGEWRSPATPGQVESALARADVVVTTRLHGLVLALKNGVPALAVDPVAGGAKVASQAAAWNWPVLLPGPADPALDPAGLDRLWAWCCSAAGRARAAAARAAPPGPPLTTDLLAALARNLGKAGPAG